MTVVPFAVPLSADMIDVLQAEANKRDAIHEGQASNTTFGNNSNFVGLLGEAEFARSFGLPLDLRRRPGGDGGVDFTLPLRFTVDVKTTRKPVWLICEEGKVIADIYVLASYRDDDHAVELIGWERKHVLARAPIRDFGYGIRNHCIPRGELKPIADLRERVMRLT